MKNKSQKDWLAEIPVIEWFAKKQINRAKFHMMMMRANISLDCPECGKRVRVSGDEPDNLWYRILEPHEPGCKTEGRGLTEEHRRIALTLLEIGK
ncbi:hypothetical protein L0244_40120 [bacterium]|nr:hypothetical protein [bacterium]